MNDSIYNLKGRTVAFALEIVRMVGSLERGITSAVLGKQILRSGTSIGAQYAEAQRAKSDVDFISKLEGALQELEESRYWLLLLKESKLLNEVLFQTLDDEADQMTAIFVSMVKKTKAKSGS